MSCPSAGKAVGSGEGLIHSTGLQKPSSFQLVQLRRRRCVPAEFFFRISPSRSKKMPRVTVTRRLRFNAAHRVFNPTFSDADNEATFGKCNNPNWHGHNYVLEVSVEGEIDESTGYVVDLSKVRDIVEAKIIEKVDHKNLNLDVDFMKGIIPTAENMVVQFWRILEPAVSPGKLKRLVLRETENNHVEYTGN